jgi:hypothetical protein
LEQEVEAQEIIEHVKSCNEAASSDDWDFKKWYVTI